MMFRAPSEGHVDLDPSGILPRIETTKLWPLIPQAPFALKNLVSSFEETHARFGDDYHMK